MDLRQFFADFQDLLAPKLDTYEQAIYLYVFRHSRLLDIDEAVIGFKSARKKIALGIGTKGSAMSETTCYEKLESLIAKGRSEISIASWRRRFFMKDGGGSIEVEAFAGSVVE